MPLKNSLSVFVSIFFVLATSLALAQSDEARSIETSKTFGDFDVHYNVFPSTLLQPHIAAHYQLVRGSDRAVLNISIRRRSGDNTIAQPSQIAGTYSDLIQPRKLEFREIREEGAIYYIAQLPFSDRETLRFDISVQPLIDGPAPIGSPFKISFTRTFYVDK
jgi:hypothetical protein